MRQWVRERLEAKDRVVLKAIESSDFKSHPEDFKNASFSLSMGFLLKNTLSSYVQVLLKEHKDSIRILSLEYARLMKQNQNLKELIESENGRILIYII